MNDKKQATPRDVPDVDRDQPVDSLELSGYLTGLTAALASAIRNGTALQLEVGRLKVEKYTPVAAGIDASIMLREQFDVLNRATIAARVQKQVVGKAISNCVIDGQSIRGAMKNHIANHAHDVEMPGEELDALLTCMGLRS